MWWINSTGIKSTMKLSSDFTRQTILDCLKNNLNRIGFSLVWIQAEGTDRFILYVFEGFLDEEKADDIAGSVLDKHEMPNNCVCTIRLTHGSPYTIQYRPEYESIKKQRLSMALLDSFNNNRYMNNEVQKKYKDFGGARIKVELQELIKLPCYREELKQEQSNAN